MPFFVFALFCHVTYRLIPLIPTGVSGESRLFIGHSACILAYLQELSSIFEGSKVGIARRSSCVAVIEGGTLSLGVEDTERSEVLQ